MQESLPKLPMDTQSVWVVQCRDAVQGLRAAVKQAKFHRAACCQVFAAALAAQLALEHSERSDSVNSSQVQQQQRLCASMTAALELAQRRIQVDPAVFCNTCMALLGMLAVLNLRSPHHASVQTNTRSSSLFGGELYYRLSY